MHRKDKRVGIWWRLLCTIQISIVEGLVAPAAGKAVASGEIRESPHLRASLFPAVHVQRLVSLGV